MKWFLLRAGLLKKNRMFWNISKWFLSSPLARSLRSFFFDIHCKNMIELLEVKLIKVWGYLKTGIFWNFKLSAVHTEPPVNVHYSSDFPIVVLALMEISGYGCLLLQVVILCIHLFIFPILGTEVCLVTSLLQ